LMCGREGSGTSMNDLSSLPTAWVSFVRRVMQAADKVFNQSGADSVNQAAYLLVDAKGVPLLWVIAQGNRTEPCAKSEKQWADVARHLFDSASDALASNKDGCAVAAIDFTFSREKKLLDWQLTSIYRVEPSNSASGILRGLVGA